MPSMRLRTALRHSGVQHYTTAAVSSGQTKRVTCQLGKPEDRTETGVVGYGHVLTHTGGANVAREGG
jgi:hypothetical protein